METVVEHARFNADSVEVNNDESNDIETLKVMKRDGRVVDFDAENITDAIMKAFKDVRKDGDIDAQDLTSIHNITTTVESRIRSMYPERPAGINEIQNLVEHSLLDNHYYDVATAYKDYRWKKDITRAKQTDANEAIKRFVRKDKDIINENANKDGRVFSTQRDLLAGAISKSAALQLLPKDVSNAHAKCDIHFHDADYSPFTTMTNCFSRDTRFVTSKGVASFEDFNDGDEINVLTPTGAWRHATVRSHGEQPLNEITFVRNNRTRITINATPDHRWILHDHTETTALKEGDRLIPVVEHHDSLSHDSSEKFLRAWVQGFVYGDGGGRTLVNGNEVSGLRLCGHKGEDYLWVFEKLGYRPTYPQYAHGDPCFYLNDVSKNPDFEDMDTEEISAFFEGYMCADGSYNQSKNPPCRSILLTVDAHDNFNVVERWSAVAGYHILSVRDVTGQRTPYTDDSGRRPTHWYRFLCGNHNSWNVESIRPTGRSEDVWCLEVDDEHAFVLEGGIPTGNCSLPNFKAMLANGFALGNAVMGSPNSIETAATQVTQIMLDVASSQYGGQTINRADEILAPYAEKNYAKNMETARAMFPDDEDIDDAKRIVERMKSRERKWLHIEDREPIPDDTPFNDDASEIEKIREVYAKILTRKNIYDAMQTMEYQVNTQHATCGQTPFVTVGFGLGTSWFSREITRCIFYIRIAGLGKDHRTAIFPKLTYTIKHGINSESTDPNYDMKKLALECTSKRMYPDILFYENIEKITGSFKAPMGCRSFLQGWINPETGEDEEEGRMNLGVVTVNIPRIAIESRGNIKKFWRLFDQRMTVAHHALQFRIKRCAETVPANAPVLWQNGAFGKLGENGNVDSLMKNSRSTVSLGYIGLYEATSMFYGREWINDFGWDDDARDFAISILHKMSDLCKEWEDAEGYHYSVYGTPSESLTDRFSRADREKFGVIPGITDHEFYTNSFHRPVWLSGNDDHTATDAEKDVISRPRFHHASNGGPFSKLDFEQPFLQYTAGGHIVYTEEPRLVQNLRALEAIWDYAHSIGIDYLGTNTPIDRCYVCNYEGDFAPTKTGYKCPQCGNDDPALCDVTKRVCGYLGNPQARPMIHGRHEELIHRKKQMVGETGRIVGKDGKEQAFYDDKSLNI